MTLKWYFLLKNHVTVKMINENKGKQKKTPEFKDRTRINLVQETLHIGKIYL